MRAPHRHGFPKGVSRSASDRTCGPSALERAASALMGGIVITLPASARENIGCPWAVADSMDMQIGFIIWGSFKKNKIKTFNLETSLTRDPG